MTIKMAKSMSNKELSDWAGKDFVSSTKTIIKNEIRRREKKRQKKG